MLKRKAINLLEASKSQVKDVVYELSTLPASEIAEHKVFLEEKAEKLEESKDHTALFRGLNLYWTYLSPHLLKHLVCQLPPLQKMKGDMEKYMNSLEEFRKRTPLELFCNIDKEHVELPQGFAKVIARFKVLKAKSTKITLQDIEIFRQQYGKRYLLRDFALMLQDEVKVNSFVVTFIVVKLVIDMLQSNIPKELFQAFGVIQLDVSGHCVFFDESVNDSCLNQLSKSTTSLEFSPNPHSAMVVHSKETPLFSNRYNFCTECNDNIAIFSYGTGDDQFQSTEKIMAMDTFQHGIKDSGFVHYFISFYLL